MEIENLYGSAKLVVSSSDQKGNQKGKIILDSLKYNPAETSHFLSVIEKQVMINNKSISKDYRPLLQADEINKMIRKKYTLSDTILIGEVRVVGTRKQTPKEVHIYQSRVTYGEPDRELIITPELSSIKNLKDLLVGRVAGIYPVNKGSGIRIRGYSSSFELDGEPLFILDGLIVPYTNIASIPMSWIDRVDVIMSEKAAAYGVRGANGIISVITKTVKEANFNNEMYTYSANITGFDSPRIFYSPKHNINYQYGQIPDNRSTLYWFPDIKINVDQDYSLKFYNADKSATYDIVIEGITSDGIPVTGQIRYDVK
jgi:hypothetical protein